MNQLVSQFKLKGMANPAEVLSQTVKSKIGIGCSLALGSSELRKKVQRVSKGDKDPLRIG